MSQSKDVLVRLKSLDATWEVAGVDRAPGFRPENVEYSYNLWGCDQASFDVRRDPKVIWPDLGAFTDVEIEVGGVLVWSGRIKGTPTRDGVAPLITIQAEGWQYHLDDDRVERKYVHTRLADWKDYRTQLAADLTNWPSAATTSTDGGGINILYPTGSTVRNGRAMGVTLDLGPSSTAARIVINIAWISTASPNDRVFVRGHDAPGAAHPGSGTTSDAINQPASSGGGTFAGSFSRGFRYVTIFFYRDGGSADYTVAADAGNGFRLSRVQVFADTAYESGNQSVLKLNQIFNDVLDRGTILLSADRSQIQSAGLFSIPDFSPDKPRSPRDLVEAGSVYDDVLTQIDVQRRPVLRPRPTAPSIEVGAWSPMEATDAEANSGENIYNKVIVAAQAFDGSPLRVERAGGSDQQYADLQYTMGNNLDAGSPWDFNGQQFPNGYPKLVPYMLRIESISVTTGGGSVQIWAGEIASNMVLLGTFALPYTGPSTLVFWRPDDSTSGFGLRAVYTGTNSLAAATIKVGVYGGQAGTLVGRRRFARAQTLDVSFALPSDGVAAAKLGDIWLSYHKLTPFKGDVTLTGGQAVRHIDTGVDIGLERLGLSIGELIRFSDRTDPDTGGHGRDARLVAYKYNLERDEATVTLDNTRSNFEKLLARMAVVNGEGG